MSTWLTDFYPLDLFLYVDDIDFQERKVWHCWFKHSSVLVVFHLFCHHHCGPHHVLLVFNTYVSLPWTRNLNLRFFLQQKNREAVFLVPNCPPTSSSASSRVALTRNNQSRQYQDWRLQRRMTTMDRNDYLSIVIVSHGSTVVIDKLTEGFRIYSQKRRREFKRNGKCSSSSSLYCSCFFIAIFCWKEAESVLAVVGGKEKSP